MENRAEHTGTPVSYTIYVIWYVLNIDSIDFPNVFSMWVMFTRIIFH